MMSGAYRPGDGELLLEDANDLTAWAVFLKKAVPANKWVEESVNEAEAAALAALLC